MTKSLDKRINDYLDKIDIGTIIKSEIEILKEECFKAMKCAVFFAAAFDSVALDKDGNIHNDDYASGIEAGMEAINIHYDEYTDYLGLAIAYKKRFDDYTNGTC